jgi:hypothetical protein
MNRRKELSEEELIEEELIEEEFFFVI